MYDVSALLPVDTLPPGTSLLCLGEPVIGKRTFGYRFAARGLDQGETVVATASNVGVPALEAGIDDQCQRTFDASRLGVVDATGTPGSHAAARSPVPSRSVSSPADLTGLGIGVGEFLDGFTQSGVPGTRVVVNSVGTLTVYSSFERVYRFLHALTHRVSAADAVGCFLMQPILPETELRTMANVFDGIVDFRDRGDGIELRVRFHDGVSEWYDAGALWSEGNSGRADADSGPDGTA